MTRITVTLNAQQHALACKAAADMGMNLSSLVRYLLNTHTKTTKPTTPIKGMGTPTTIYRSVAGEWPRAVEQLPREKGWKELEDGYDGYEAYEMQTMPGHKENERLIVVMTTPIEERRPRRALERELEAERRAFPLVEDTTPSIKIPPIDIHAAAAEIWPDLKDV